MANIIPFSFRGASFLDSIDFQLQEETLLNLLYTTTNPYTTASTVALLGTGMAK